MVIVVPLGKRTGSLRQERPFLQFAPLWTTCLSKENPCVGFLFIYLFFYFLKKIKLKTPFKDRTFRQASLICSHTYNSNHESMYAYERKLDELNLW